MFNICIDTTRKYDFYGIETKPIVKNKYYNIVSSRGWI